MSDDSVKDQIIAKQAEEIEVMRSMINILALINKEFLEATPEEFWELPQYQRALSLSKQIIDRTGGTPNLSDLIATQRRQQ